MSSDSIPLRLFGYTGCTARLVVPVTSDFSAVTASPYGVLPATDVEPCAGQAFLTRWFDTTVLASPPRTDRTLPFDVRAPVDYSPWHRRPFDEQLPTRTFGVITVRTDSVQVARWHAAGIVWAGRIVGSCHFINPNSGALVWNVPVPSKPVGAYVLENPPDTTTAWGAWVSGYLYAPETPLCGDTIVFHLESRQQL